MLSTIIASLSIIILPVNGSIPNLGECNEKYSGGYVVETETVYICFTQNKKDLEFVKYHEIGHHLWFKILNEKQREEYTKLYNRDIKKGKFYREYGKTNVLEDFADNFSIIINKVPHTNTRLTYIRKLINAYNR